MMMAPQVVGVLLKKPGQQNHPRVRPMDPQETKIRGELYVEDLGERRMVSIRMGWLWVEGTPSLALRALNLRQASPGICQPHALALGFTLSNTNGHPLATFWADTEPIYWSWVRAIAAELVRQTPFRSRRCLNFLEILTICPRGSLPLPDSPPDSRRRSRSELRCRLDDSPIDKSLHSLSILDDTRRRARSELRCWSSSNSSDEDIVGEFRSIPSVLPKPQPTRTWGCSESSEGSDDSLPWGANTTTISLPEAPTREQRIQRYKEARRRENEARTKRVLEEDARRRKARAEENNNDISRYTKIRNRLFRDEDIIKTVDISFTERLPPIKPVESRVVNTRCLDDSRNNNICRNSNVLVDVMTRVETSYLASERRSRARERKSMKNEVKEMPVVVIEAKDLSSNILSRIPISRTTNRANSSPRASTIESKDVIDARDRSLGNFSRIGASPGALSTCGNPPCEEDVARLLERCQRVDHYVPVREKLNLFESLSRMGGRLARSTEDLGRSSASSSPKGKQRARSLHDLNRGVKAVPVREMCRLFEGDNSRNKEVLRNLDPPCVRASTRRRQYLK
ncbi:uncharacterized protein [Fopius arisanus]|uniref:AXIN1 protein n=1 Tax=Fopius arisanus TaxID=64838 RepID=A0A0C9QKD8_9HYME|nr:PREDICTED: uncharacterized protein LOC105263124 [Fopius arisanus]